MGMTIQIITKTNCCTKNENNHNEDLNEDDNKDDDENENEKLIIERINSFSTDINNTVD